MRHFIKCRKDLVEYFMDDKYNKIGDISYYSCYSNGYWLKYREVRGRYKYSKKTHYENSNGAKVWYYDGKSYLSYEEYMMAVMG